MPDKGAFGGWTPSHSSRSRMQRDGSLSTDAASIDTNPFEDTHLTMAERKAALAIQFPTSNASEIMPSRISQVHPIESRVLEKYKTHHHHPPALPNRRSNICQLHDFPQTSYQKNGLQPSSTSPHIGSSPGNAMSWNLDKFGDSVHMGSMKDKNGFAITSPQSHQMRGFHGMPFNSPIRLHEPLTYDQPSRKSARNVSNTKGDDVFAFEEYNRPSIQSETTSNRTATETDTPTNSASFTDRDGDWPCLAVRSESDATVSNEGFARSPDHSNETPPVWHQETHPNSFKRLTMDSCSGLELAYPGAFDTLRSLNPEMFQMPWGSRVVSIKTEHPGNVIWAVRHCRWVFMQKVGTRVMKLWNERRHSREKVYFLLSINNSKRYCGLAEMAGPWTGGGDIQGWEYSGDDEHGTIPITWKYVKNVWYERFAGIYHENNKQPIVNMWNGMHFPGNTGRKMLELYVTAPHLENALCWTVGQRPMAHPYGSNSNKARIARPWSSEGFRNGMLNKKSEPSDNQSKLVQYIPPQKRAILIDDWRNRINREGDRPRDNKKESEMAGAKRDQGSSTTCVHDQGKHLAQSISNKVALRKGDVFTFVVNDEGELVPITPPEVSSGESRREGLRSMHSTPSLSVIRESQVSRNFHHLVQAENEIQRDENDHQVPAMSYQYRTQPWVTPTPVMRPPMTFGSPEMSDCFQPSFSSMSTQSRRTAFFTPREQTIASPHDKYFEFSYDRYDHQHPNTPTHRPQDIRPALSSLPISTSARRISNEFNLSGGDRSESMSLKNVKHPWQVDPSQSEYQSRSPTTKARQIPQSLGKSYSGSHFSGRSYGDEKHESSGRRGNGKSKSPLSSDHIAPGEKVAVADDQHNYTTPRDEGNSDSDSDEGGVGLE